MVANGFDALAGFVAPYHVLILAALREASAAAGRWVEEETFIALSHVNARLAFAALLVPDGTAWALSNEDGFSGCGVNVDNNGNTLADALAHQVVPDVSRLAGLSVASALALLGIPVVSVVDTGLRSADKFASISVEGVDNTGGWVSVGSLESADAVRLSLVPVVSWIADVDKFK